MRFLAAAAASLACKAGLKMELVTIAFGTSVSASVMTSIMVARPFLSVLDAMQNGHR